MKIPSNWWVYAVAIAAGFGVGYYIAKGTYLVYKANGTPIGPSIGTDPTVNFVS